LDNGIAALLTSVLDEWNKAEEAIKIAEQVNGEIINPAVYELRYAGRRIVEALSCHETDIDRAKKLLQDAQFDCSRARHDAIDAAVSKISHDLNIAVAKIGARIVHEKFPNYVKLVIEISAIHKLVTRSRKNREDRDKIYETLARDNLTTIVNLYGEFQASEDVIRSIGRWSRFKQAGMVVAWLVSTGIALAALYVSMTRQR
jgi:hypothetical protein